MDSALSEHDIERLGSDLLYSWISHCEFVEALYEIGSVVLATGGLQPTLSRFVDEARHCGAEMRIVALFTDTASVARILQHIGEPTKPPVLSPVRHCATQSCFACVPAQAFHGLGVRCSVAAHPPAWEEASDRTPVFDPSVPAPEPAFEFDQSVTW